MKILSTNEENLKEASELLDNGKVVIFPTETVYGIGADALNEDAVNNVFKIKGRPNDNPLILTVSDIEMMEKYAHINVELKKKITSLVPGPFTFIFNLKDDIKIPDNVVSGLRTGAFRIPGNESTRNIIKKLGRPIVGPSANISGKPSPTRIEHILNDFKNSEVSAVIDDGISDIGLESTIIDFSVPEFKILRPGRYGREYLLEKGLDVLDFKENTIVDDSSPKAPGMKYRHYSPHQYVEKFNLDNSNKILDIFLNDETTALIAFNSIFRKNNVNLKENDKQRFFNLGTSNSEAAFNFFDSLRFFDNKKEIKKIFVQQLEGDSLANAYNNRLNKASNDKLK